MSLIYLSFPFVLAAAATATNGSHLLPPLRPHRLLQVCPGTGDCSACVTVSNCVWCADAGYCSSSGTCISGGPARTCPSAPSASSVAWPHAGALGLFGVGVAATAALAVFTFSSSVQTSGALVWHPPTHKQRADVRLLFLGSSALWLAFTYYECSTVSTPGRNSRLCVTIPTVSFVDQSLQSLDVRLYLQGGVASGAFMVVATFGFLFPAAVIMSLATYRMQRLATLGIPPFFQGCSPVSLATAQLLAWVGLLMLTVSWWVWLYICERMSLLYSTTFTGSTNVPLSFAFMPGSVMTCVAVALTAVGCVLASHMAIRLHSVSGVGCTAGYCCCPRGNESRHPWDGQQQELALYQREQGYQQPHPVPTVTTGLLSESYQQQPPRFMVPRAYE